MKRFIVGLGAALLLLIAVATVRTLTYRADPLPATPATPVPVPEGAAERLAGSLRFATISHEDPAENDSTAFAALHAYLAAAFPRVHAALGREVVGGHSLLYTWPGSDPALKPILLLGHMDVVPVEPGTESRWREDPFGGRIVDGFIWGRGAIDNKSAVLGTLEAVEMLLAEGFNPVRTVYLAFGHDEEVGGSAGARTVAALLRSRGVALEWVMDEGGIIGQGVLPGISQPTALVGVAEKGYVTVELSTRTDGGHSSLPPRESAVGILAAAVARLEERPMPARLQGATAQLFDRTGPLMPLAQRAVFANLWATRPLVIRRLEQVPATNAMIRTTTAPTIFQAGTKDNVLPSHARAAVNFRIMTGDSIAGVLHHVRRTVDDPRVRVERGGRFSAEPSAISSTGSPAFRLLERTIRGIARDAVVAPYLVVVVTDARHYADLSDAVFRFTPLRLAPPDLDRIHGTDERIAVPDYEEAIRVYRQLIVNGAGRATAG